jgi:hypothetical protein
MAFFSRLVAAKFVHDPNKPQPQSLVRFFSPSASQPVMRHSFPLAFPQPAIENVSTFEKVLRVDLLWLFEWISSRVTVVCMQVCTFRVL